MEVLPEEAMDSDVYDHTLSLADPPFQENGKKDRDRQRRPSANSAYRMRTFTDCQAYLNILRTKMRKDTTVSQEHKRRDYFCDLATCDAVADGKVASRPKACADLNLFKNNHNEYTCSQSVHNSNIKGTHEQNGVDIERAQCNTQRADTPHSRQNRVCLDLLAMAWFCFVCISFLCIN